MKSSDDDSPRDSTKDEVNAISSIGRETTKGVRRVGAESREAVHEPLWRS